MSTLLTLSPAEEEKVVQLWNKVFEASNLVLKQAAHYGFDRMLDASPNLHEIVAGLAMLDGAMTALLGIADLSWEHQRPLHNAKAQVSRMRELLGAVIAKDQQVFDEILNVLEKQFVA